MEKLPGKSSPPGKRGPKDDRGVLTEQIVTIARDSFAKHGYASTTMRSIAEQAGVNHRLIGYYFDSKQALLEACLIPPPGFLEGVAATSATKLETRGRALVSFLLTSWEDPQSSPVLRSILLIAAHESTAHQRLQLIVRGSLIGAVSTNLDDDERSIRGALIATQMLGLAMTRYIWRIEPIASMPENDVIDYISPTIQRYLTGNLNPGHPPR